MALALGACGSSPSAPKPPPAGTLPALATDPRGPRELVFSAPLSPQEHGPIALTGRYVFRFVQYAPENPREDFTTQTPFVARLRSADGRVLKLFHAAAREGRTLVDVPSGRWTIEVSFGDYPYVVRVTPVRARPRR